MKNTSSFNMEHDLFSGKKSGAIAILSFKERPLTRVTSLSDKKALFDYLDLISSRSEIKVLLIMGAPVKMGYEDYKEFYQQIIRSGLNLEYIERFFNAVSQFVLKLVSFKKMVVHADSGKVILLFMNISLACDYRIITDNTVFMNPNLKLGLVPKGGGVFFLSKILGSRKTSDILLSGEDITAAEALELGIVDKVVPMNELSEAALKAAQVYVEKPANYLSGIKRLLNYDITTLADCLETENDLIRRIIKPLVFKKMVNFYNDT